jgi:hypothetical protein
MNLLGNIGRQIKLSFEMWVETHKMSYPYATYSDTQKINACAGIWRFSNQLEGVAAFSTLANYRR